MTKQIRSKHDRWWGPSVVLRTLFLLEVYWGSFAWSFSKYQLNVWICILKPGLLLWRNKWEGRGEWGDVCNNKLHSYCVFSVLGIFRWVPLTKQGNMIDKLISVTRASDWRETERLLLNYWSEHCPLICAPAVDPSVDFKIDDNMFSKLFSYSWRC